MVSSPNSTNIFWVSVQLISPYFSEESRGWPWTPSAALAERALKKSRLDESRLTSSSRTADESCTELSSPNKMQTTASATNSFLQSGSVFHKKCKKYLSQSIYSLHRCKRIDTKTVNNFTWIQEERLKKKKNTSMCPSEWGLLVTICEYVLFSVQRSWAVLLQKRTRTLHE